MANKPLPMNQIRKCLVLLHDGRSIREINRLTGTHRKTIHNVLQRLKASALSAEQALALPDDKLSAILHPPKHVQTPDERYAELSQRLAHYARELNRRHVTKLILWEEYLQECPHGYRYSQFCRHLEQHIQRHSPTMPQIHRPGDKIQIDFAGDSLGYIDPVGKQWVESPVLVCTLPYSAFFYAEPLASTRQEHLIPALNNMLKALGGVPRNILSDNMSQVVTKPSRYEPVFTELMEHWTTHYRTNLQATRSGKPKDKPSVEKSVHIAYQQIYARMRNERHTSLKSLKHRFSELLDKVNDRVMASYGQSRFERFQELEKPCLGPLPEQAFPYKHRTLAKVKKNYHVILGEDWHQYSVPHQHIGKRVALVYDEHVVEIFLDYERIAVHKRKVIRNGYSTLEEHMPESHRRHKHLLGWTPEDFTQKARAIGPNTEQVVSRLLQAKAFPEQSYDACLGVLRLKKAVGAERLEAACAMALKGARVRYRQIKTILENNRDKLVQDEQAGRESTLPRHENIRGPLAFT